VIEFYGTKGEFAYLSNFYNSMFELEGKMWPTVEHYYQASKATTTKDRDWIAEAFGPGEALKRGRSVVRRADWESVVGESALHVLFSDDRGVVVELVKDHIMYTALISKFTQRLELARALVRTGDEPIVEASPDGYWGWGKNKKGLNKLGRMHQLIRKHLPEKVKL
jgi:ribA/ribD-fused uncharacterized protein